MNLTRILLICIISIIPLRLNAQSNYSRIESIKNRLESLSADVPNLSKKVSFSISGVSLTEFLRALATNNKLNLNIDPSLNISIAINFTDVTISDLLVYLSDQYSLEIVSTGNILSVLKYTPPAEPIALPEPKEISVQYYKDKNTLSFDLQSDTLAAVIKKISILSNYNIIIPQKLQYNLVSGYVNELPIDNAINELAYINNLTSSKKDSTTYLLQENIPQSQIQEEPKKIKKDSENIVTNRRDSIRYVNVQNMAIKDLLKEVSEQLNMNYFLFSEIKGTIETKLENMDVNTFMKYIFNGTDYTYRVQNGIYLIGDRKLEEIRTATVYTFKYRTVTKVLEYIPTEFKKGVELIPLTDLNSMIISGSRPVVNEIENFLIQIDKVVPVVNIEIIILDVANTHNVSTGISAGIDKNISNSSYSSIYPSIDMTLGANTINSIIGAITGTGLVNLGSVTPGFYLSLKLSEDNGQIKIRSTPRLATLNGSTATMSIGETRYYAEPQSNVIATQNTTTVSSILYKPLEANLSINITPIVSLDEQITLDISVEQASFTNQIANNGPYGQTSRTFKSSLRVKNNDMILLGGLEEKSDNNTGRGIPILSRIPILKWIFSSRSSNVKKSKLAILIHPTVFY